MKSIGPRPAPWQADPMRLYGVDPFYPHASMIAHGEATPTGTLASPSPVPKMLPDLGVTPIRLQRRLWPRTTRTRWNRLV